MPGENCCIPGCGSCRNTKGLGFFKLPSVKKDHFKEWRKKMVGCNPKSQGIGWQSQETVGRRYLAYM